MISRNHCLCVDKTKGVSIYSFMKHQPIELVASNLAAATIHERPRIFGKLRQLHVPRHRSLELFLQLLSQVFDALLVLCVALHEFPSRREGAVGRRRPRHLEISVSVLFSSPPGYPQVPACLMATMCTVEVMPPLWASLSETNVSAVDAPINHP